MGESREITLHAKVRFTNSQSSHEKAGGGVENHTEQNFMFKIIFNIILPLI